MQGKKCGTEVFARVTGFFRPVEVWNKGKTQEFKDRKRYDLGKIKDGSCRLPGRSLERGVS